MQKYIAYAIFGICGVPIFYAVAFTIQAFISMNVGTVFLMFVIGGAVILSLLLLGGGYLLLPDKSSQTLIALAISCFTGAGFMLTAFVLSLIVAPDPFFEAIVPTLAGTLLGIVCLVFHYR